MPGNGEIVEENLQDSGDSEERVTFSSERALQMPPRLPIFSGDAKDSPFDLWLFEVQCLQVEKRAENEIKTSIRRSLKGQASRTLMLLGIEASVEDIIVKFKSVFGPIQSTSTVLSTFYSIKQREGEDAGVFASRLEDCAYTRRPPQGGWKRHRHPPC